MKGKKGHKAKWFILAAILLSGCSGDDSPNNTNTNNGKDSEIRFNADVGRMMEGTRATTIDNTALQDQDILIDAYHHDNGTAYLSNAKLHYDSSWKFWDSSTSSQLHYYWPEGGSLDFVGYCPFGKPAYITTDPAYDYSAGTISFSANLESYMTNTSQASMQEYLIAVLNEQTLATQTAAGGALPLVFKHPFALVKFVIAEGSGTVKINGISIAGLKTSGTCTYNGSAMSWSSQSGSTDMTITPATPLKYGTASTETTPFIVIPHNYGSMTLTVNGTWDDWSDVTKDLSTNISINWESGCIYTYNLTVTKYALKVDTEKYTEQW